MMQDLRPEIEAINEEMRNVSTFIFFSSPCSLYGIFVGFTGYAIMLYYFTMHAFQSTDPRSMEVGKQKLGELFIRYAALCISEFLFNFKTAIDFLVSFLHSSKYFEYQCYKFIVFTMPIQHLELIFIPLID